MNNSKIVSNVLTKAKYIGEKAESPRFWESATTVFFIPIIIILVGIIVFLIIEKFHKNDDHND